MKTTHFIESRIGLSTYAHMEEDGLHLSPVVDYGESTRICINGLDEEDYPAYILRADGVYFAHAPERVLDRLSSDALSTFQKVFYELLLNDDKSDVWYLYEEYLIQHRPVLKYAIEKLRKMSHKPNRAAYTIIMVCFGHIKETESLLSCPHSNYAWALLEGLLAEGGYLHDIYMFTWDKWTPAQRRHAVRNWCTYELTRVHRGDVLPPMYEWHEPRWDFLVKNIGAPGGIPAVSHLLGFIRETRGFEFTEKDMKYIQRSAERIYDMDINAHESRIECVFDVMRIWWDNLCALNESCDREAIPRDFDELIRDPYWRHPRDLIAAHDENILRLNNHRTGSTFNKYADKYAAYKIDTIAGGYRFYTSGDERTWQVHATKLSQCVYASKYYEQKGIIVFVEKDGNPYGTIHWCNNRIDQARITQKVYSESEMPQEVQDIFTSQVVPQYEVLQNA